MAHFAQIDEQNIVLSVITLSDDLIDTAQEFINESLGLAGTWIQCSYNGTIRDAYPGAGWVYVPELDIFVAPKPLPWLVLNEHGDWICPIGIDPATGNPLTDAQWEFLEVVYAIRPTFSPDLGRWTPRNEKQYEEGLQRANLSS